jgi:hypothetical protein
VKIQRLRGEEGSVFEENRLSKGDGVIVQLFCASHAQTDNYPYLRQYLTFQFSFILILVRL